MREAGKATMSCLPCSRAKETTTPPLPRSQRARPSEDRSDRPRDLRTPCERDAGATSGEVASRCMLHGFEHSVRRHLPHVEPEPFGRPEPVLVARVANEEPTLSQPPEETPDLVDGAVLTQGIRRPV